MNLVLRRRIGVATWLTGALVCVVWSGFRTTGAEARGIGFAPPRMVSPPEPGILKTVNVNLHQMVTEDTLVAEIDPTPLLEEQAVLQAQLLAVQQDASDLVRSTGRQFAQSVEGTQIARAQVLTALRTDEALARTLRERVQRERAIAESGAGAAMTADDLDRELQVVQARIDAARAQLAVADRAAKAAEQRATEAPAPNEWQVVAAGRLLEQVEGRIRRLGLQANIQGQVSAIFLRPGDYATPGIPVLQVSAVSTLEVVGFVSASRIGTFAPGDPAKVVRASGQVLKGHVESVGSGPQLLPELLWVDPQASEWGVPVKIVLEGNEVGPNEPVTVRL
ncbi:MAG: HlyD family efflux transporter periplasmic adaptor subunit [Deltaproteobacteria bacterium]|nr:HlyD family efflux transporter periplasmic adaptor subunit [Deltaproteobacteria bacterium]